MNSTRYMINWCCLALLFFGMLSLMSCGSSSSGNSAEPDPFSDLDFSDSWNSRFATDQYGGPFGHDGNPVISQNFMVISGTASQAERQYISDVAEESLAEVLEFLDITTDVFDFLPTYDEPKIHILAIKEQDFGPADGFAYRDGAVILSRESPRYTEIGHNETTHKYLIKHEITHVVESLLIGSPTFSGASDVWWREGFAQCMAYYMGGQFRDMITTTSNLEEWQASHVDIPGGGNPIDVHIWDDFPQVILDTEEMWTYYKMFELTVRYLLDPDGYGALPEDVLLYDAMGDGVFFDGAMLDIFGLDIVTFEDNYWDIMFDYLDRVSP